MNRLHHNDLVMHGRHIQPVEEVSTLRGDKYLRTRSGDFTDSRLMAKLGSLAENHLVLLPPEVSSIDLKGNKHRIKLKEKKGLEKGRQNSVHNVQFGQLVIESDAGHPITEQVAVKYMHPTRTVREFGASRELNNRFGKNLSFTPLGFIKDDEGKIGYISRYEHNVISLDNILWNPYATQEKRLGALAFAGAWMATLHDKDLLHHDAQAKNIAFSSMYNPRYPDLETMTDMNHGSLDSVTKRLLDVSYLFNRETNPYQSDLDEITTFVHAYGRVQGQKDPLDEIDMIDVIEDAQTKS